MKEFLLTLCCLNLFWSREVVDGAAEEDQVSNKKKRNLRNVGDAFARVGAYILLGAGTLIVVIWLSIRHYQEAAADYTQKLSIVSGCILLLGCVILLLLTGIFYHPSSTSERYTVITLTVMVGTCAFVWISGFSSSAHPINKVHAELRMQTELLRQMAVAKGVEQELGKSSCQEDSPHCGHGKRDSPYFAGSVGGTTPQEPQRTNSADFGGIAASRNEDTIDNVVNNIVDLVNLAFYESKGNERGHGKSSWQEASAASAATVKAVPQVQPRSPTANPKDIIGRIVKPIVDRLLDQVVECMVERVIERVNLASYKSEDEHEHDKRSSQEGRAASAATVTTMPQAQPRSSTVNPKEVIGKIVNPIVDLVVPASYKYDDEHEHGKRSSQEGRAASAAAVTTMPQAQSSLPGVDRMEAVNAVLRLPTPTAPIIPGTGSGRGNSTVSSGYDNVNSGESRGVVFVDCRILLTISASIAVLLVSL